MTSNTLPQTMRAAQWRTMKSGIDKSLTLNPSANLPANARSLSKGQSLVKVAYASINHLDYKVAEMPFSSMLFTKPVTPGLDYSGTIVSTTLDDLKAGRKVFGRTELPTGGTLAEYVVVDEKGIAAVPDGVSMSDAACIGICGTSTVQSLMPFVERGGRVFINGGSGGVGVFAIQVAKTLGAHVTVTCSASNADFCHSLGAGEVIDYESQNVLEILKNGEEAFDLVYDTIFSDTNLYWQSHHYLKPEGKYICVGFPPTFSFYKTLMSIKLLPGWSAGGKRPFKFHSVVANRKDFGQIAEWIRDGKVKIVIEEEFGLEDAGRAYGRLKEGRTRGKLVVRVGGELDGGE
ncbi:uncharacterized protein FIESC28_05961 [Fusarium coffeatum]|uniref:Enoyl reductase (ER) domain-containing protein n=1 Tax=Fusarium coffeatum TaxID=231269 RepID=A0A366RNJ7_9HYPO|nr:uncharacterized protein FIESC28_05961 [Fusarium coffeatum]RBR18684.1 hypothetical protein FIESC28_05961 [Fusarium coffeatum]